MQTFNGHDFSPKIKNGAGFFRPTPPDYRTDGGVGWLAGARGS
jgi:hypothetical protein